MSASPRARVPHPREAIVAHAKTDAGNRSYWLAILIGAEHALLQGRDIQALDAISAVVAAATEDS